MIESTTHSDIEGNRFQEKTDIINTFYYSKTNKKHRESNAIEESSQKCLKDNVNNNDNVLKRLNEIEEGKKKMKKKNKKKKVTFAEPFEKVINVFSYKQYNLEMTYSGYEDDFEGRKRCCSSIRCIII